MPTVPLPNDPTIDAMKRRAKLLQQLARAGDAGAADVVAEFHPQRPDPTALKLTDAQLVIARQHDFASWPKLRAYLGVVAEHTRRPTSKPTDFAALACLNYGEDSADRWQRAAEMEVPSGIHAAAAAGDADTVRSLLERDPLLVHAEGGGYDWVPLLYATYSRIPRADTTGVVRVLLDAGADPNAGYLWYGMPWPFTALTGAFGGGEGGQPPHVNAPGVARMLLEAGADPNDAQTTYNRSLIGWDLDDPEHLEIMVEFGFGGGDGGPWHQRLGKTHPSPAQLAENELRNAAEKNRPRWARLMIEVGANLDGLGTDHPIYAGETPMQLAARNGNDQVVEMLRDAGATPADDVQHFLGDCMNGRRGDVSLAPAAIARRPFHLATAADRGRLDAVRLMAGLGFDVNAPDGYPHHATALHYAAFNGDAAMVDLLLERGADRTVTDSSFRSTPAGWADHAGHTDLAARLTG